MTTTRPGHDHESLLRLVSAGGRAAPRRALLEAHASAAAAWAAGPAAWRAAGLAARQIQAMQSPDAASLAHALQWLALPGHHLVGWHDTDYPALLRHVAHPPLALFVAGDPALLWHPAVAVVGSRAPTAGGRDNAGDFARALAASGLCVASGMAAGIDTAAHTAALTSGGRTIAVLGTGPDVANPRSNTALHARIVEATQGVVVSEHPPGTAARREHFPSRNRILAGLTLGTVVIEAAERSGALITARLAAEAGREVFALPGSIHNPLARGCHRLIRDGAALVHGADEVIAAIGPLATELAQALRGRLHAPNSSASAVVDAATCLEGPGDLDYQQLWQSIGHDPTGMDQLAVRTGLTTAELSSMLLVMELEGRVVVEHGRYSRKRPRLPAMDVAAQDASRPSSRGVG